MFPPKPSDIFPPEGGCSEGLDAFRFFLNPKKLLHHMVANPGRGHLSAEQRKGGDTIDRQHQNIIQHADSDDKYNIQMTSSGQTNKNVKPIEQ